MSIEIIGLIAGISTGVIGLATAIVKYYFHYKEAKLRRHNSSNSNNSLSISSDDSKK